MISSKTRSNTFRAQRASTILELAVISPLLVVMSLFCLDILILATGSGINERACRDAARMAGQATNYAVSLQLAQAAVKTYQGDGYYVTSPTVDTKSFVYNDFGGSPPPNTSPYVTVTTNCQVRVPAAMFLYGLDFGSGHMTFIKTYTFPIVTTAS
jgi:hypothetical protein